MNKLKGLLKPSCLSLKLSSIQNYAFMRVRRHNTQSSSECFGTTSEKKVQRICNLNSLSLDSVIASRQSQKEKAQKDIWKEIQ